MRSHRSKLAAVPNTAWAITLLGMTAVACHDPAPPPRWAEGGAQLALVDARWTTDNDVIELRQDGAVVVSGDRTFIVDRVGRVVDDEYEPVALLMPDGQVVGPDATNFGHVGLSNGAPPGSETAWLSIQQDGHVVTFDTDGERYDGGRWEGCHGHAMRTCTLITHVVMMRARQGRYRSGPYIGIGVGRGMMIR